MTGTRTLLPLFLSTVFLQACLSGTAYEPTQLDADSHLFPASRLLPKNGIKHLEPFDAARFRKMLLVRTRSERGGESDSEFFLAMFRNMNTFDAVLGKKELELQLSQTPALFSGDWEDPEGLSAINDALGPFLMVEVLPRWHGYYDESVEMKAVDPASGRVVFHVVNRVFNWSGLDQPLFFPVLNAFLEWTRGGPVRTGDWAMKE